VTRAYHQINWNLRDLLCDKCLAKVEADEDTPIAEYCDRCKRKLRQWTLDVLSTPVTEEMRRAEEQVPDEEDE
jgi:predicted amidophosphoribosyltransferase